MSNVPKGYKQTEVGVVPEDWEVITLGDLTTKVGSGITPTGGERVYKHEGRPFLRSQNIGWGKLILDDVAFIDDITHESFKSTEVEIGDVFLNITGASIGRSSLADKRVVAGNVNQHVCIIRTHKTKLKPLFLNCFLLSQNGQKQIESFQAGGNRQGLNFGQIKTFIIPIPPTIAEQTTIADVLSDTDELIQCIEKLINKKRAIKQAAMQKLFKPKDGWEVKKLGEIGTFSKGSGIKKDESSRGEIPCIRYGEIYTHHSYFIKKYYSFISMEIAKTSKLLKKGDLLFAGSGETKEDIGKCIAFTKSNEAYAGGDIIILSPRNMEPLFLGYYLNTSQIAKQKASKGQGDAIVHITASSLQSIEISLPDPTEQTRIASILSDMDAEIAALETKLTKYKLIKQGMMQNLLTGRIRLI